jgi:phosphatidylinositol alpha-1,6-mannosyltransferase
MLATERGVAKESTRVIPLGVDAARFAPLSDTEELKREFSLGERQVILFVGRLARRKGVKEFVENCLPVIVQELPETCFVVAGGNPTDSLTHRDDVMAEIEVALRNSGLQNHARLCGEVGDDELIKLYRSCDVVVLPALALADDVEGFGMVLLEAGAAGKPVIATKVGGIPDAVDDGRTGILVNAGDYRELSKSVLELLADANRRQTMGELSRRRMQTEFSWETVVESYESVFSC